MFHPRAILAYKPLHFLLGGILVFMMLDTGTAPVPADGPVVLDAGAREQLRLGWAASTGRDPSQEELAALVQRELDDEVLFREGLTAELHRRDPVVRQRLALNMRFLGAAQDAAEDELVDQAIAMDMHRSDLVVRRRMVQVMELALQEGADRGAVTREELDAMYAVRREELALPARWRILQVYFSGDRRGAQAGADAVAAAARLRGAPADAEVAIRFGDPFLGGHALPLLGAPQLASQFGAEFVDGLSGCTLHEWCAPVASSFGAHAVLIQEFQPARVPAADEPEVRRRLESDVRRSRGEQVLAEALQRLRRKYGVAS